MKKINQGFTFLELLIAVAIIAVMSTIFWTNLHHDDRDVVHQETERLAAEIRQTRSLVLARVPEASTGEYPVGGYGVHFYNNPPRYIVFAEHDSLSHGYNVGTDTKIKEGFLDDTITSLVELGGSRTDFYFRFTSSNEIVTNVSNSPQDFYAIGVVIDDYRGNIRLGENTEDGLLWTSMGVSYDVILPEDPSGGGGGGKGDFERSN